MIIYLKKQNERYLVSFAYAFKEWGWDMKNPSELYKKLCEIHNLYENFY